MRKQTSPAKKILTAIVVVIVFYFLGQQIWGNWRQVCSSLAGFNWLWGIGALLVAIFHNLFSVLIWEVSLKKFVSVSLPFSKGIKIWSLSQMGRYVPGKVWMVLGRLHLCERENIPKIDTAVSMSLEMILVIVAALLLFVAGLPFWPLSLPLADFYWVFILLAGLLICLHPWVFQRLFNVLLRLTKQKPAQINVGFGALFQLMVLAFINWLIVGAAIFCIMRSIYMVDFIYIPIWGGIFGVSLVLGMFALFAPSGLGVRDGILAYLLTFFLPGYVASLVTILTRLLFLLAEGIFFVIAMAIAGRAGETPAA